MSHCHRYEKCHPNRAPLPRTNEREVSMRTMAPVLRLPAIVAVATWSACLLLLPLLLLAASNPLASSSSSSWFHHPQGIDDGVLSSSKRKESRRIQKPKRRVLNSSRNLQKFWQSSSSLVEVQNRPLEYEGYQSHRELAFGDYAETPETCPATTTCPVVCVADAADCPASCGTGQGLCADTGQCSAACFGIVNGTTTNGTTTLSGATAAAVVDTELCLCSNRTVACPRVVDFYDTCKVRFDEYYQNNTNCIDSEVQVVEKVSFAGTYFILGYVYFCGLAVTVMIWCYYNQIVSPIATSTVPLQQAATTQSDMIAGVLLSSHASASNAKDHSTNRDHSNRDHSDAHDNEQPSNTANPSLHTPNEHGSPTVVWTQTGYKVNVVGSVVDTLVELSFALIQLLLLFTTLFYYMQQEAITRWQPVFRDEVQALQSFILVWMVGFVWCFAFRYPSTGVQSLFLRRCPLSEAVYVAVVAPTKTVPISSNAHFAFLHQVARQLWRPVDAVMRVVFSHPYDQPGMETVFCPVQCHSTSTRSPTGTTDDATTATQTVTTTTRSILHRMRRYVFDAETQCYIPCAMSVGRTFGDLMKQVNGLSHNEAQRRLARQGPNVIPLAKPTVFGSLYKEFSKSVYLYQNFCIWVYANLYFFDMASVYTFCRFAGAFVVVYFQHKSDTLLYNLSHVEGTVEVLREGDYTEIPVEDVVPGDVVVLQPGVVYCDMVVLKGFRVLVDESALTGEATPLLKAEVDRAMRHIPYDAKVHKVCTISAGTEILELNEATKTLGLVMATGSYTAKGELLTDVLSYERHSFQYSDEAKVVLAILMVEALILTGLVYYFLREDHWVYSWFYSMYVVATVIPLLLPTVFIMSMYISARRLQGKRISCPYPEALLMAGKVDATFFDKTGTLTELGMEFISFEGGASGDRIRLGMAVCHTLTTTSAGQVVGNQVDMASFATTGATLTHEKGDQAIVNYDGEEYIVLKRFEFDSHRATQSVVVEDSKLKRQIYVKGSPEVIKSICMETSLPPDFERTVRESAAAGIYQIAMAYRSYNLEMELADVRREDVEGLLTFGGFINFRNPIRDEALHVLETIEESEMTSAMITGDNVFTGIFIAREANMIKPDRTVVVGRMSADDDVEWYNMDADSVVKQPSPYLLSLPENEVDLAISGVAWNCLTETNPNYATAIMKRIRVFGRCKPKDKVSVVATFVSNGYTTLMCGDGQNDCGCLKTAHVGVALSNAEASIVAPFTSLDKNLVAVLDVLREGRCALASTLSAYCYYIMFGQIESFLQVVMAYLTVSLSEWCWVFLDGIFTISLAFSIPLAQAASELTQRRPTDRLLGVETLCSVCGILAWNFLYVILALVILFQQDWFQCRKWDIVDLANVLDIGDNYESSVLFIVGGYQYIASAIVMNFGYTFRQAWYRNYIFVLLSSVWTLFFIFMTLVPSSFSCIWRVNCENENVVRYLTNPDLAPINNPFNTTVMPMHFRFILIAIMVANFVTVIAWQRLFVHGYLVKSKGVTAAESGHGNGTQSSHVMEDPMNGNVIYDDNA